VRALQDAEQADEAVPALLRRELDALGVAERRDPEAVAAPRRHMPNGDRDAGRDIRLAPIGGAEVHRRRRVEQQVRHELALGEVDAHVRDAGACGDVPLDQPHVVAGDVRAELRQLDAVTLLVRAIVAGEQAAQPPPDHEIERAERFRRQGAGAGLLWRRRDHGRARLTSGTGTVASTESRIVSALTSSASAS
jgi:hypothetical protein